MEIMSMMASACGKGTTTIHPYETPKTCIESRVFPSETCNTKTAMLIFADDATTNVDLENCARLMHEKIKELQGPTLIIGDELGLDDKDSPKFLSMKLNRDKKPIIKVMSHAYITKETDNLMDNHCTGKKTKKPKPKKELMD
jgi:hypothetical protein